MKTNRWKLEKHLAVQIYFIESYTYSGKSFSQKYVYKEGGMEGIA